MKQKGHAVEPNGASYLVHLAEEDPQFPAGLNGRFHGILIDRKRGSSSIFNDRYGMHRIYYHEAKQAFYFAGEAKAILAVRPELMRMDTRSMGEFVTCGCVLENRTLFQGISVLPPASVWKFHADRLEHRGVYFQPREWENQTLLEEEAYYKKELRAVFAQNLPRYFQGREPIGVSLTGGLDTRMIMAWRKSTARKLPCYSFGGMYRDCQDVVMARKVAEACGQTHEVIPVADEFLSEFPRYAERSIHLTDGCIDVSHSADLYVNERAATIAPVRMTGNYGGEVLRRVRAFKPTATTPGLFTGEFIPMLDAARTTYSDTLKEHPLSFAVFRQAPWHHYGLISLEQTQVAIRSPFLDNDLVRTIFRAPHASCTSSNVSLRLIADGDPILAQIRTDRGKIAGDNGPRARAFQRLIDFTVKAEYAYDYGMPQWLARVDNRLAPLRLERLFLGRHKFYHYRVWYRDFLRGYIQDMLLDPRTLSRPYLERKAVESIVRGHVRGERNYTVAIHKVLTLELIHRLFIDSVRQ